MHIDPFPWQFFLRDLICTKEWRGYLAAVRKDATLSVMSNAAQERRHLQARWAQTMAAAEACAKGSPGLRSALAAAERHAAEQAKVARLRAQRCDELPAPQVGAGWGEGNHQLVFGAWGRKWEQEL
ncbi:unnamed protein product [Effrenium voratum]|nr:unnamed protein product [Effrenium voratum]